MGIMQRMAEKEAFHEKGCSGSLHGVSGRFVNLLTAVIGALAFFFFAALTAASLVGTGSNPDLSSEYPLMEKDSILCNLFFVAAGFLLCCAMGRFLARKGRSVIFWLSAVSAVTAFLWVAATSAVLVPQADQLSVWQCALAFQEGDYSALAPGGYAAEWPHQWGLITVLRLLAAVFGENGYQAFRYCNALAVAGVVYGAAALTREIGGSGAVQNLAALFMCLNVPLYLYTPFVYGDLLSVALCFGLLVETFRISRQFSWGRLLAIMMLAGTALLIRENSLLIVLAIECYLLIVYLRKRGQAESNKDGKKIALLMAAPLLGLLIAKGSIAWLYEPLRPAPADAIPSEAHLAMGLQAEWRNGISYPGWFNGYNYNVFLDNGYDAQKTAEEARGEIQWRLSKMSRDPLGAARFYSQKFVTQWNVPLYQAVAMNAYFTEQGYERIESQEGVVYSVYDGMLGKLLQNFANWYQCFIYLGGLLFVVLMMRQKKEVRGWLPLIAILGGGAFSMMWEAKSRYVFPYFLLMIPLAAVSFHHLSGQVMVRRIGKVERGEAGEKQ